MAVDNDLLASTLKYIVEEEVEAVKRRHAFLDYADKNKGTRILDGGSSITVPVSAKDHSLLTWHSSGYEGTDESIQDVLVDANYQWAFVTAPITISSMKLAINAGDSAIIDLYSAHTKSVMDLMGRNINAQILNGSILGTGGSLAAGSNVLETLYGAAGAGVNAGFLEGVAKASQNNTVGGLSKATYNVPGYTNAWASGGGAFATNGKTGMDSIQTQIMSVFQGEKPIDCIIASEASFRLYKQTLFAQEHYYSSDKLDGGRMELLYGGAPLTPDLAMTVSGRAADAIFSMYFINFNGVKLNFLKNANFALIERGTPLGYSVKSWQLQTGLQLTGHHLGSLGVLTNSDS